MTEDRSACGRPGLLPALARFMGFWALCTMALGLGSLGAGLQGFGPMAASPALATMVSGQGQDGAQARKNMVGELSLHFVVEGETLLDVAMQYGLGFVELRSANPNVNAWAPEAGTPLVLPTQHILPVRAESGILVNTGDLRLYYFPADGGPVQTWPISTGREAYETPTGLQRVTELTKNPTWIPTANHRAEDPTVPRSVPPGPENPLGSHRIRVGWNGYAIHGTNRPNGIGRRVSRGCIRMYPEHVEDLFALSKVGMKVSITNQPAKFGWIGNDLYLEVHPSAEEVDLVELGKPLPRHGITNLRDLAFEAAGSQVGRIDWNAVFAAAEERRGIPVRVTR